LRESGGDLRVNEKILWLDISVNDIAAVAKRYSLDHLVDVVAQALGVNSDGVFFEHFEQVFLDVFEYKVETSFSKVNNEFDPFGLTV
jgi:hypothetical protein